MSADLYFTRDSSFFFFFFLLFFFSYSLSSLNGTNPYPATRTEVSVIWKCMSEIWGIPPLQIRAQNDLFGPTSQLKGDLLHWMKHSTVKNQPIIISMYVCVGSSCGRFNTRGLQVVVSVWAGRDRESISPTSKSSAIIPLLFRLNCVQNIH